jgi:uncharacterized protein (UPF0276 family)
VTRAGIGVKPFHYRALLQLKPSLAFVEVHAENYMGAGGPPHAYLEAVADLYPLSLHGVCMSLGGAERLDPEHLSRWRTLIRRYKPALISEHVAWSGFQGRHMHDLLPIPYTKESLALVCDHVEEMQDALDRTILVENPSSYVSFRESEIPEADFMVEVTRRTGCGLLLDVNNVFVSAFNSGFDPRSWLARIPADVVGEIHLSGHSLVRDGELQIRIDDHGSHVSSDVWALYSETIARIGPRPTLIEWDSEVPALDVLLEEADRADEISRRAQQDNVRAA